MTQVQFCEVQEKIKNFPADELHKIKSKLNLKDLRNELSKLNMDQQFLRILARKYKLKYPQKQVESGPNTTQINTGTEPAVKINQLLLQNGYKI